MPSSDSLNEGPPSLRTSAHEKTTLNEGPPSLRDVRLDAILVRAALNEGLSSLAEADVSKDIAQ